MQRAKKIENEFTVPEIMRSNLAHMLLNVTKEKVENLLICESKSDERKTQSCFIKVQHTS